jgi:tubulin monoglycylase TTLL3/8
MCARHLDLLRDLSSRNREKEEQQRRDELRLQKRASSLRERILSKNRCCNEGDDSLPVAPPDASASAEELRQWKVRCNLDIERRQEEAIRRLQELQRAKQVKEERERLKREWRAHKAKTYLLDKCQDVTLKEYLESKEKPRALPKIPTNIPATNSASRCLSLPSRTTTVPEAVSDNATSERPQSATTPRSPKVPVQETISLDEPEEAEKVTSTAKPPRPQDTGLEVQSTGLLNISNQFAVKSINKFLCRVRNAQTNTRGARDLSEWKKRNGCPQEKQVFICCGGYPDFTEAMLARGWFQNKDQDSRFFDLKWSPASKINHDILLSDQTVNHFLGNREITTKVGLTLNIRNCAAICGADHDTFYPRAYDLYDPQERADFVLNFKFTKAQAILREFIRNMDSGAEMTFSDYVISLASKICMRCITDPDEVLDSPELAEALGTCSTEEWAVLEQVCIDDVTQRLQGAPKAKDLEDFIQKRTPQTEEQRERERRMAEKRKAEKEDKLGVKTKKKKKESKKEEEEVELCAPRTSFEGPRGQHLLKQAKSILMEMDQNHRQYCINGCRNVWIVKPSGKSRGRGIKVMRELDEIFRNCESDGFQWICQKYIERPQLIKGYKFDIRQWVLVTDFNPLTIYIWNQPYLRFAGQKYDETMTDRSEYVHLSNNSIIKYMDGFEQKNKELSTHGYMWFRQQYEEFLHESYCKCEKHRTPFIKSVPYTCESFGVRWEDVAFTAKEDSDDEDDNDVPARSDSKYSGDSTSTSSTCAGTTSLSSADIDGDQSKESMPVSQSSADIGQPKGLPNTVADDDESVAECENLWMSCIRKQIEEVVIRSLRTCSEGIQDRKNTIELFGYDFMVSEGLEKPEVWLIEVNSSPACDYSTPVTCPLVKKMMEDTAKVIVDLKQNPDAPTGEWELLKHKFDKVQQVTQRANFAGQSQLEVVGKKIKAPKAKKKKKKASKKSENQSDAEGDGEEVEDDDARDDEA